MSQNSVEPYTQPPKDAQQVSIFQKYLKEARLFLKKIKEFDYKLLFDDILTFVSIIMAYFIISLSYLLNVKMQKWIKVELNDQETLRVIVFLYCVYLISWNIISWLLKRRAERPPPKKEQYYEEQPAEEPTTATIGNTQQQQPSNTELHYHQIINSSLHQSIYLFLLLVSISAYAYLHQTIIQGLPPLINIQQLSYIGIWFILANLFYTIGKIIEKCTKLAGFKILGLSMGCITGIIVLGLANGLNTFIFI